MNKVRLDLYLTQNGYAVSRSQAQQLIEAGHVKVSGRVVTKTGHPVTSQEAIEVKIDSELQKYVSRGGLKLEGALEQVKLNCDALVALDIGLSTGGFTDCLLQRGVARVVGVDVGHGQTHAKLKTDPRLKIFEGINARDLKPETLAGHLPPGGFDLIVMDLSFISQRLVIPNLAELLSSRGFLLSLVKPQFEVGPQGLGKGGLVKDEGLYQKVEIDIKQCCGDNGFKVLDYFPSSIEGGDGNKEFFIYAQKS